MNVLIKEKYGACLTPLEASAFLDVQPSSLAQWRCRGEGPTYFKDGGRVYYPVTGLKKWTDERFVIVEAKE